MRESLRRKLDYSVDLLRKAERMALRLDPENGFWLAFSGGKDSQALYHVARLAGMPASVVARAEEILRNLELVYGNNEIVPSRSLKDRGRKSAAQAVKEAAESGIPQNMQLSMFQLDDPVLVQIRDQIKGIDINALTPLEALNKLNEIKKITGI